MGDHMGKGVQFLVLFAQGLFHLFTFGNIPRDRYQPNRLSAV